MRVRIDEIVVNGERSSVSHEHVRSLADSLDEVGLLHPITLDESHTLIAGLHRLEAAKLLGWEEIECVIIDATGLSAELAEIDENLIRKEMTPIESGLVLSRRKVIYEELHPGTKRGGDRRSENFKLQKLQFDPEKSFIADTAEKTGKSERAIALHLQIAKNVTPEAATILNESGVRLNQGDSLKLSRLKPEQQSAVAMRLASDMNKGDPDTEETEPTQAKRFSTFDECVRDLKAQDKDTSYTPEEFLGEVKSSFWRFLKDFEWYSMPYYESAIKSLTQDQIAVLFQQTDSLRKAADKMKKYIEKVRNHEKVEES